jgi:hypothetical protein
VSSACGVWLLLLLQLLLMHLIVRVVHALAGSLCMCYVMLCYVMLQSSSIGWCPRHNNIAANCVPDQ